MAIVRLIGEGTIVGSSIRNIFVTPDRCVRKEPELREMFGLIVICTENCQT